MKYNFTLAAIWEHKAADFYFADISYIFDFKNERALRDNG